MSSIARPLTRGLPVIWVVAGLALAMSAAAGAWTWARQDDGSLDAARSASARAASAEAAAAELSQELERLESRLTAVTQENSRLTRRLERVGGSLWASLKNLRAQLSAARAGSREAMAAVDAAAAEAASAARKLSVLEDRFEYHLRADHGGG